MKSSTMFSGLRWFALVVSLGAGACVEPASIYCDTLICAPGSVCTASGCARPDEAAACATASDGVACTATAVDRGVCVGGACRLIACGDGIVMAGEVCDDGNTASGDGCAADCASREVCGNGIKDLAEACDDGNTVDLDTCHNDCSVPRCGDRKVDTQHGEVCDDGNLDDQDGCAANCRSSELCGNGVIDAHVGEACDDGNLSSGDGCQATCQVPRCGDGVQDATLAEACDDGNLVAGDGCAANCRSNETCGNRYIDPGEACDNGAANSEAANAACRIDCQPRRCGDSVLDDGERCDDGNNTDGDGCASACQSAEVCGNAYVDTLAAEQCDDAWVLGYSGDGCSSRCEIEAPLWRREGWIPASNEFWGAAYDAATQQLLMLPGMERLARDGWYETGASRPPAYMEVLSDTRDGGFWGVAPSMVDDGLSTLWRYHGGIWQAQAVDMAPLRNLPTLVYDHAQRGLMAFGGADVTRTPTRYFRQTFVLGSDGWSVASQSGPSARSLPALVSDLALDGVLLFGGLNANGMLQDTWLWQGGAWTKINTPVSPPRRAAPQLVYHNDEHLTYMFGGIGADAELTDLWRFDGRTWELVADAAPANGIFSYDTRHHQLTLVSNKQVLAFRGGAWTRLDGTPLVMADNIDEVDGELLNDTAENRLLLIGQYGTWWHTGLAWRQLAESAPPWRKHAAIAFDGKRQRAVFYGGQDANDDWQHDTWEFDGTEWLQVEPEYQPNTDGVAVMAYDERGEFIIMVQGEQTWRYNGVAWEAMSIAAPHLTNLVYDARSQRLVGYDGDIWVFDGAAWTRPSLVPALPAAPWIDLTVSDYAFAFDPFRQRVLALRSDGLLFELMTDRWRPVSTLQTPPERSGVRMAWDARRSRIYTLGYTSVPGQVLLKNWVMEYAQPSRPAESCLDRQVDEDGDGLAGCADPDCWYVCTPGCSPLGVPAAPQESSWPDVCTGPRCGDGLCSEYEDPWLCPGDCG